MAESQQSPNSRAYVIVVGNEKGGSGKTTTSVHLAMQLLEDGHRVSTVDLDSHQRTFTRYLENRQSYAVKNNLALSQPIHFVVNRSALDSVEAAEADERSRFTRCLRKASGKSDYIIIDAPGHDIYLSRLAHSYADTVITPINDSFLDMDVLGNINAETLKLDKPGVYSEALWQAKLDRAKRNGGEIDWVVLRNRLTTIDANNKHNVADALLNIQKRLGCRVADGFSERVIFRELFLKGLTLLDVFAHNIEIDVRMTHIAARQELRSFVEFLALEEARARALAAIDAEMAEEDTGEEEITAPEEAAAAPEEEEEEASEAAKEADNIAALQNILASLRAQKEFFTQSLPEEASYSDKGQKRSAKAAAYEIEDFLAEDKPIKGVHVPLEQEESESAVPQTA